MFSTVRCCLEWQRVQPEQPHRVDIHQPPLSLDRGLNCFQIFSMLYATISFALQRYMCRFFIFYFSVLAKLHPKRSNVLNLQNIYVTADDRNQFLILYHWFHSSSENPLCLSLPVSLHLSLVPGEGGGKMSVNVQTECAIVRIREKQKAEHYFVCSFPHVLKLAW